jgi:hypothetical protein
MAPTGGGDGVEVVDESVGVPGETGQLDDVSRTADSVMSKPSVR